MSNYTYALISDIHANLPALETVLADILKGAPEATYHLGDLVGYGPWPNETISLLQAAGIAGVAGNYDSTVARDYKHCGCRSESAREEELSHISFEWTRGAVSPESKDYRSSLRTYCGSAAANDVDIGPWTEDSDKTVSRIPNQRHL